MELYTPVRKPRIAAISYKGLSRLVRSILPDYADRAEIRIIDKVFEDAAEIAHDLVANGEVDVLLSAGANAAYLKDCFGTPVVRVQVRGVDMMRAIRKARQMSDHIAVITYAQTDSDLEETKDLFNLDIEQRSYSTVDDAKETFSELAHRGFRVIIGSSLITELAESQGLIGILAYSRNSVRRAIEDAIEIARIRFAEEQRAESVRTILGHLTEAVVAVDQDCRIVLLNPAMEELTGLTTEDSRGKVLEELVPNFKLKETVKSGRTVLEKVEKIKKRTVVTNRIPILNNGTVIGAVLTIQDARTFSRVDRNIRSRNRRTKFSAQYTFDAIIGESQAMKNARRLAEQYARTDATILLTGETGTGKELFAQSIHNASARRDKPFVAVNCAAIPDSLLESELFGYEEGAFTDSRPGGQAGLFELAHTGTIFLDEIAEMPVSLQTRLLRVLQEKVVMPLGGDPVAVDARVIAASNRDLETAIDAGDFRQDLYYRLNILHVNLPPLREREDDALRISKAFLRDRLSGEIPDDEIAALLDMVTPHFRSYSWPGNVRELENMTERLSAIYLANKSDPSIQLTGSQLATVLSELLDKQPTAGNGAGGDPDSLKEFVEQTEYQRIRQTIDECNGNISAAARKLKLSRTTLWRKLRRFDSECASRSQI